MPTRTRSNFRASILSAIKGLLVDAPAVNVTLSFFDGTQPANADLGPDGNLLCLISVAAATAFGTVDPGIFGGTGIIPKAGVWSSTVILAGTVTYCRLEVTGVGGNRIMDFSCGLTASGADLEFNVVAWTLGGTVVVDVFEIQIPHSV